MVIVDTFPTNKIGNLEYRIGRVFPFGATITDGGVNFSIFSKEAKSCTLFLYHHGDRKPFVKIPFPEEFRIGDVYTMMVFGINIETTEYGYSFDGEFDPERGLRYDKTQVLLDPYAKSVSGRSVWGKKPDQKNPFQHRGQLIFDDYDWEGDKPLEYRQKDLIIYEMHVRSFTNHPSSEVKYKGTFAGILEKVPYLKELGINCIELMPIFEFDEMLSHRDFHGRGLMDYWGYNTVCFFAPNTSYASTREHNHEGDELKSMIKELNENGIEVFLDVVFNHTAEGNENGPFFSFKGLDNNIYYMLTPEGYYYNFSGCGNTLNCNHPIVQQMILECLRYWVTNYRVDGFRFDLATILGRNEDGSPMSKPPLLQSLAFDPILGKVKLIAEAWDAGGMYQVGSFPSWNRWMEWNGRYRDDMRAFLKGDCGKAGAAASRITGSPDLYDPEVRGFNASVNFLDCHDGFTLHDLYTYNEKHNEDNDWGGTDGDNHNLSWNCGIEGETTDKEVRTLRDRMIKNAFACLMTSRGAPMFFMGDEFGNSQGGNNNAYCQDNNISWLNWGDLKTNKKLFEFFKFMIRFRKDHPAIRKHLEPSKTGFPEISCHGARPWEPDYAEDSHYIGVMFAGSENRKKDDDIVYIAINTYWENVDITLPELPMDRHWQMAVNTYDKDPVYKNSHEIFGEVRMYPRSVRIFTVA